jgi:hypothetical protein
MHTDSGDPSEANRKQTATLLKALKSNVYGAVLLDKLIVPQLVKESPAFYGEIRFITVSTTARNLFLT